MILENMDLLNIAQLPNIPDEIFNVLRRLATTDKRIPETMIFENDDFELVQTVLGCIKINLTKSSETVTTLIRETI